MWLLENYWTRHQQKLSVKLQKNIPQHCSVQSCIWQGKQLWQRYSSEQNCLGGRVNGPALMYLAGHFVSTLTHTRNINTHAASHTLPQFPFQFVSLFMLNQMLFPVFALWHSERLISLAGGPFTLTLKNFQWTSEVSCICSVNFLQNQQTNQQNVVCQWSGKNCERKVWLLNMILQEQCEDLVYLMLVIFTPCFFYRQDKLKDAFINIFISPMDQILCLMWKMLLIAINCIGFTACCSVFRWLKKPINTDLK